MPQTCLCKSQLLYCSFLVGSVCHASCSQRIWLLALPLVILSSLCVGSLSVSDPRSSGFDTMAEGTPTGDVSTTWSGFCITKHSFFYLIICCCHHCSSSTAAVANCAELEYTDFLIPEHSGYSIVGFFRIVVLGGRVELHGSVWLTGDTGLAYMSSLCLEGSCLHHKSLLLAMTATFQNGFDLVRVLNSILGSEPPTSIGEPPIGKPTLLWYSTEFFKHTTCEEDCSGTSE